MVITCKILKKDTKFHKIFEFSKRLGTYHNFHQGWCNSYLENEFQKISLYFYVCTKHENNFCFRKKCSPWKKKIKFWKGACWNHPNFSTKFGIAYYKNEHVKGAFYYGDNKIMWLIKTEYMFHRIHDPLLWHIWVRNNFHHFIIKNR